jgi:hypothetical protein
MNLRGDSGEDFTRGFVGCDLAGRAGGGACIVEVRLASEVPRRVGIYPSCLQARPSRNKRLDPTQSFHSYGCFPRIARQLSHKGPLR